MSSTQYSVLKVFDWHQAKRDHVHTVNTQISACAYDQIQQIIYFLVLDSLSSDIICAKRDDSNQTAQMRSLTQSFLFAHSVMYIFF